MTKNIVVLGILFVGLLFFYQNCSKVTFKPSYIGDNIEGGECVEGKKLSIYLNDAQRTYLGDIVSYSGTTTSTANYNYYSASAHPIIGPTPVGYELHTFFYEGTDGLTFNFLANIDEAGSQLNHFNIDIVTSGNSNTDRIVFTDDPAGSGGPDPFTMRRVNSTNVYHGEFNYGLNTDGGIVGAFNGEDFEMLVTLSNLGDINGARFYSADGGSFNLGPDAVRSFIIKYREYEDCADEVNAGGSKF